MLTMIALSLLGTHSVALTAMTAPAGEQGLADFTGELLAQQLERRGVKVMTPRAISAALSNERQKQLMGCSDTCVSELAGALGVDALLLGDLAHLGSDWAVNVRVVSAASASTLASFNERSTSQEGVPLMIERAAWALATQLAAAGWEATAGPEPKPRHSRLWALAPAAVGIAGLTVGVIEELEASARFTDISRATSGAQVQLAVKQGRSSELVGAVALSVGGAALVAAAVVFFTGEPGRALTPVAVVTPSGASLGVVGVLP
jgi:hypothetical protein